MHQFVQSAIEAANQGDSAKAMSFLKQVLAANPRDVDAWLVLAAVVEEPERKRQCLERVLTLDPANKIAREELLEMDRAAMIYTPPFEPEPDPVSIVQPQPVPSPSTVSTAQTAVQSPVTTRVEKTLVFKYPIVWRIVMYVSAALLGCIGLMVAIQNVVTSLPILGFAVIMLGASLVVFPSVEVSNKGIRVSGVFSSKETGWDEIVKIKPNNMKSRLELTKRNKEVVNVSTQVSGYPQIVEILQKRRPDLFGMSVGYAAPQSTSYGSSSPAPAFTGTRTFRKSFIKQYGFYLLVVPFCLLAAWTAFFDPQHRIGALLSIFFCAVLLILPLFQVSAVKVEPDKITIETLFEEKEFTARQIKDIKMQSERGRRGHVTNYVNIIPAEGKNYPLQGFSDGDEIIYGFLVNWWNAYHNR